jgi:hypothetical protein
MVFVIAGVGLGVGVSLFISRVSVFPIQFRKVQRKDILILKRRYSVDV